MLVPCCRACNDIFARVEACIASSMRQGPEAARAQDRTDLAAWAAKVLWGFAVFESRLNMQRSDRSSGRVLDPEKLRSIIPLQQICQRWMSGHLAVPGSLFAFPAQHEHRDDFDYLDDPPAGLIGVRLGPSAIIIDAVDHCDAEHLSRHEQINLGYLPVFSDLAELDLGPIQFREAFAWARTLQRSRPPIPSAGTPFGRFNANMHMEHLRESVGALPAFTGQPLGCSTFLFEADLSPRFVPMLQTRLSGPAGRRSEWE